MIFYLLNKGQQTVKLLNNDETIESNLDEAINTASELKFSLPLQKRLDSNIYYILIPDYHGNDFLMFKVISEDVQKDRVEYSAVESAYDELKSYSYIKDIRPNQMNAAQMLQQVLKNTRWSLGYVEDTGIQSSTFYYITVLEAIQKIVDLFKVELTFTIQLDPVTQQITGRKVNLYQQQGRRTGKRFEYGSNLLTVTREEDSQNLVTALVGRGKGIQVSGQDTEDASDDNYGRRLTFADVEWKTSAGAPVNKPKGQEYVEDPKATALYGFSDGHPRIGLVTFDDIEDPNQLINATWSALLEAKRPKVSFKAVVTDVGNLQLGDTIAIIRHDLGIEYFTRVYKVHHNLKDEKRNTVEMGDDFSSRSITSAISTAIQTSQDATTVANTAAIAANGKNRNFYSNTKPNFANEGDNLYLDLGNGETELWVWHHGQWEFVQSTVELHTVQKEVQEAQSGLSDAKKQISDNLAKADGDIAELNANIREQKKAFDTDIDELNASIRDQKKAFDTDIDELNASIRDQKGTIDGLSTTINTVAIPKITDVTNKVSDTITKVNEQKNIVTELQNQATQQGKDISKITADVHGVTVDLANLNGDVNQTKVTVQGLQSTLGNAQGNIAQIKVDAKKLETSLSSKVDNSTYATFVNQTNQALNAKLVASDLNGYAKTTDVQATANGLQVNINSVADRMNNLKIGAENLLTNTGDLKDYQTNNYGQIQDIVKSNYIPLILNHPELTHMGHIWTDWQSVYSNQEVILEKDKPYWFGFYVCTDRSDGNPFGKINILGVKKESDLSHSKVFVEQNIENYSYFGGAAKHWVWHTYKIIGDDEIYSGIRVEGNKSTGGSAYIAGYTLVQSDVAPTGHINSLEDTKHELSQLSAQITANNQKFSSYYTKVETDSKANTAKNDAISAIKNDGNWHGLTNILTNSGFLQTSDGFTQKVQQTTQPMINSANSGGVNLLVNTYNFGGFTSEQKGKWTVDPKSNYSNNAGFALIKTMVAHVYGDSWNNSKLNINQTIYLPAGKYIFSFLASVNSQKNNSFSLQLTANINGVNKVLNGNSGIITYSWQTHTMEFVLTENSTISNIQLYNSSNSGLPGGSIYFANLKLESGSLATTWCPAPEDYATQTSFSELNQTVKGLQSTVSSNYTNLQSQLSQTAGTISTVVGKVNNLELATNVQNVDHGIDLNTYKSTGTWFVKGSGTNAPASNWFYLDVKTAWDGRIVQIWQSDNVPTDRYVRTYIDDHWSNWERSASYSEYSTLNQTVKGLQSTVSNNYTNLQTQISQTDSAIREELSNQITGVTNQITTTASGLTARIDNIRVGGRNLLHGTSDQYRTLTYKQQYYATTASDMWTSTKYYHAGYQFTYSATITNTSEVPVRLVLYCYDNDKKTVLKKAVGPTVGPTLVGSIPTYVSITMDSQTWFLCSDIETLDGQASSFSIQVKDEQLEKGTVPTQWTANPDDVASQFVEINATINGLQSTVSGNYGALQTQISQTDSAIREELSNQITGVTNQITTTASGLNARISAIQIGGRNLLHNTSNHYRTLTGAGWLYQTTASDMWTSTAEYHSGDQFTYSANISNISNVPVRLVLYCYGANKQGRLQTVVGPTVESGKTAVTSVSITMDSQTWFLCSDIETLDGEASTFSIQVKDEKLEEGNVRTAWTTNPDDIASQFTEVNATINGLQSTVGSNYSALQSQINQTATTIRGEVTNSVSGLQTQITQQDNNFNVSLNSLRKETAWQKVTTAIDANNYTTTGNYWIQAAPNSNTPDGSAWAYLQVVAYPDVQRIKQTWQRDNNVNETYTRLKTGNNWSEWQKTVTAGNIMAQINMSAGTTLIQNNKIYMDASSTVFSGKAFIPDAAITNISADKINTGTLDAGRINVINLNASNITTGTINGANLKIDLNSGEILFQKGRIASTNGNLNIDLDNGRMSVTNWMNQGVYFENGNMVFDDQAPWLTSNNDPKYGGIKRADWSTFAGSNGLEIYAQNGIVLKSQNFNGALDNGSFLDSATMGAAFGLNKDGEVLLKSTKYITLTGGNRFDLFNSGKYPKLNSYPSISIGTGAFGGNDAVKKGSRIVIEASYLHVPSAYVRTTGSAPNVYVADDGALVRSTSASKYKTNIQRSYSTDYGEKLLNLPTATWTDKGQKERYEAGKRHIKPEKYFGMIAEDLADAGLDLLVSRNPETHEIEGIQYERIAPALLPVIKKLKDKVNRLEKQINER